MTGTCSPSTIPVIIVETLAGFWPPSLSMLIFRRIRPSKPVKTPAVFSRSLSRNYDRNCRLTKGANRTLKK